jgi:hypothetical protein
MITTLASPRKTTAKYSQEEKERATLANGGEATVMIRALRNPPMAEHMMAMPRALETNPFLFNWYPSQVVGTFMGSPGILNRIPVMDPPKTPPQYTEVMSRREGTMPMRYVKGRTRTMAFNIVIPGSAPAKTPIVKPTRIMEKFSGSKVLSRPLPRSTNWSNMIHFSFANLRLPFR